MVPGESWRFVSCNRRGKKSLPHGDGCCCTACGYRGKKFRQNSIRLCSTLSYHEISSIALHGVVLTLDMQWIQACVGSFSQPHSDKCTSLTVYGVTGMQVANLHWIAAWGRT
uniref:Uncharacterized protein n=1 Tax=Triticum urartu TaxID=4572 RepID=A0A8R7U8Q7_TRIUA